MRLQSEIQNAINHKEYTVGVFLDFNKAYDMLWREGLLYKISNLNIDGNMYNWIKDFLTGRTFQVKVGNSISEKFNLENGTPQGSVISPLLFLLMINDFPQTIENVQNAIFADDCSIWKSGRDVNKIIKSLQTNLGKISSWCELWGFSLSKEKTIAVIFSRKTPYGLTDLYIHDNPIPWKKEIKFLGLIFDARLTWESHINYIYEKCKKRINLMRCLSGTSWGANKTTLMLIYKALIRSVMDYGCIAYNTASEAIKKKLNKIQSECLRISCGAMKSTAIAAMQVECGEQPLELRREQQQLRYGVKISSIKDHQTATILKADKRKIKRNKTSYAKQTANYITDIKITHEIDGPQISPTPPWHFKAIQIIYDLHRTINKETAPEIIQQAALQIINDHPSHVKIYTDGSKDNMGRVGSGVFISDLDVGLTFRLPNCLSVYTSELVAIREGLRFIRDNNIQNAIILSDSLSALQSLETGKSISRPNLLIEILMILSDISRQQTNVLFAWVPSHVGIQGNEIVDKLAKLATTKPNTDLNIPLELKEAYALIDEHIMKKWQMQWSRGSTGRAYFDLEPSVGEKIKFSCHHRDKETTITRIRLGKCYLNFYLKQINKHTTGLCSTCQLPETIEHFTSSCRNNNLLSDKLKNVSLTKIMSDKKLINTLYEFIKAQGRRI